MIIAVTGNLGTGKSTVSKLLAAQLGADLLDTDQLCRQQLQPGREGFTAFKRTFGQKFFQEDGDIDRLRLRQAVFTDGQVKVALEEILHPIVRRQVAVQIAACKTAALDLVVEVPLLYEVGWQDEFDICIVVYVPEDICVQRVILRDEMTAEEIMQIIHSQIPIKKKLDYADFIVDNSGILISTVQQTYWLAKTLTRK